MSRLTSTLAVRREQSERTRAVLLTGIVVSVMTLLAWLLPGVATGGPAELPATISLTALAVFSAVTLLHYRPPKLVSEWAVSGFGVLAAAAILSTIYNVGVFTPTVMAAFVAVYYFALGDSATRAWAMFVVLGLGYAVIASLYILDLAAARAAQFVIERPRPIPLLAFTTIVEAFFGLTFWLGRFNRRATLQAMTRLEKARQQSRRNEALLNEARAEFDRRNDASRLGRLSGHEVGSFLAEEVIGRGAMGEVYRAVHPSSGQRYAIKVLHPFVAADGALVERFKREVQIAMEIDSPHVVHVVETGVLEDGSPWFAMDLLEGRSLNEILRERVRLSLSETADLVAEVARGLSATHGAGVVHRDIKPQNLFLSENGSSPVWKILDFGVSSFERGEGTLTRGATIGTPSYMSPEQTRGQKVDHRADVFALGVIAYRALTGRPAFTGNDDMHTMYNVAHVMPVRPGRLVTIPEDVERALALALAKDRESRFDSAAKFAAALLAAAHTRLTPSLRASADRLLEAEPWGSEPEDTPGSQPTRH